MSSFLSNFSWFDFGLKSSLLIDLAFVLILAWIGNFIAKRYLVHLFQILLSRYSQDWSKIWLRYGVINKASHFVPALIIRWFAPLFQVEQFPITKSLVSMVLSVAGIYILVNLALVSNAFLRSIEDIYETFAISLKRPIRTYVQVLRIIIFGLVGISITALFLNMSPWTFVTGLGAATAIILLIFRDSILGLVASVQVSSYDMIRIGDWIEMPAFGADGDVTEINLNTIKVRNFDKTISTIPAAALLSTGVRNWRGMVESGGRRIKRSINIDLDSIKFCDQKLLDKLKAVKFLKHHIDSRLIEISLSDEQNPKEAELSINGRRLTNIGLFRAYIIQYLSNNSFIHGPGKGYTFLVRQLQPTDLGLPLEIYVFTTETAWDLHENIQADIFDHLFAALTFFELKAFQGSVIQKL